MDTYYKATRRDGTDFRTGTVDYAAALASGTRLRVSTPERESYKVCTADVLHASLYPEETLIGGSWPCRLFKVTGRPVASGESGKYGFRSLVVTEEVEGWRALGPQGRELTALIERARRLTLSEVESLSAGWSAAWSAGWSAAWSAARDAARAAARSAARDAAWNAALAAAGDAAWAAAAGLVVRDLITTEHYDTLTGPWRRTIGPIHPDDPELT